MKLFRFILLLIIILDGCVEPYEIENDEFVQSIVVDGMITDKPGPYFLKLNYSTRTSLDLDKAPAVTGASIVLHDDEGNTEPYKELGPGLYSTSASGMQGVVGRSYHITITVDEKQYVSKPSRIYPAGTINDVYATFAESVLNPDNLELPQNGIRVYFNAEGEQGSPNLFRWRWTGTYEVETYPALRVKAGPMKTILPDPIPCSGYIAPGNILTQIGPCECCRCYVPDYGTEINISENQFFQATEFNNMLLATVPYDSKRFYFKYRIALEQLSLDEEAYDYWRIIKQQQEGQSDIFQPNTVRIKGNVECVSNPSERVLGFFSASAVEEKLFDIPKSLNKGLLKQDTAIIDCRVKFPGSSNQKPPLW
jgi:hypothetical protein